MESLKIAYNWIKGHIIYGLLAIIGVLMVALGLRKKQVESLTRDNLGLKDDKELVDLKGQLKDDETVYKKNLEDYAKSLVRRATGREPRNSSDT